MEPVALPLGSSVYEAGSETSHLYFPTEGIISMLEVTEDGSTAEIAVVGNEGVVGISLFMGGKATPSRAVVQSAGSAERLRAQVLQREFKRGAELQVLLLRYTMALITQMSQTAVCYRHHSAEQQLCRWLLMSLDRLRGNELVMTQELIADMLGVRRQSVTEAARKLQADGVIRYARGRITTLDRPGLEQRACECYTVVKKAYERLLSNGC
ncbi:MAG TPA: Crp/Fnr family transcriptional regulator [Burkholderiales bacterium]|nr:Crp/Fnr family transcriptional regulator [Burkholderiales bacterium]